MTTQSEKAARFLELHRPGNPLLLPNPWDQGSARLLASLGFQALATTSSGFAATLGRLDGSVSRGVALAHAATIVAETELPVSADLENGYADEPAGVARTVVLAVEASLAGCSLEDFTGREDEPIYDIGLAAERVAAAAEAAHAGPVHLVLTARAENYLHGRPDLADTIARLQAYQAAGADVLYAPGLTSLADIRQVVSALDRPVNVLAVAGAPPVSELAEAGVSRVSVGGAFAFAALGALVDAATELRDKGTYGYLARAAVGREAIQRAVLRQPHYASPRGVTKSHGRGLQPVALGHELRRRLRERRPRCRRRVDPRGQFRMPGGRLPAGRRRQELDRDGGRSGTLPVELQ
jgi:2-methylisocitrate lyase-like PEP mutase family enzyme